MCCDTKDFDVTTSEVSYVPPKHAYGCLSPCTACAHCCTSLLFSIYAPNVQLSMLAFNLSVPAFVFCNFVKLLPSGWFRLTRYHPLLQPHGLQRSTSLSICIILFWLLLPLLLFLHLYCHCYCCCCCYCCRCSVRQNQQYASPWILLSNSLAVSLLGVASANRADLRPSRSVCGVPSV